MQDAVREDGSMDMAAVQKHWMTVIERHDTKRSSWLQRVERIEKIYADTDTSAAKSANRKYCVLWANVQTIAPAVYARAPKCAVSRRFQTPSQQVRDAVQGLERATNITIEDAKLHDAIMSARHDRLIAGRGTIWIRYKAEDDETKVTGQYICAEHVNVKDYGHGMARTWAEVDSIWRRTYMSKEALQKRFGADVMERAGVTLDYAEKDTPDAERQASVYEIWCKSRNQVYWIARTAREALDAGEPPLKLKNFFPCPKPVFATLTNESCIPTPDYIYYQDQAEEIARLTRRIDKLTDSLKLVGFYPAGPSTEGRSEIERALQPQVENKLIPVASWAAFAEKGGASQIQWLPVKDVAEIIRACVELRRQLIADVYQITGISDIMRGETDATETLGAQELKAQYGSTRLRDTKDDFVRFAKEACEIVAEIIAEHYTPEVLGRLTAMPVYEMDEQTQQPMLDQLGQPMLAQWVQLLRNQLARDVLVDVETDSTIRPDEDAEKQRRTEFMTAFGTAMAPLMQLNQIDPAIAQAIIPLFGDTVTFVVRGFRAGRELEERVEETMQQLSQIVGQRAQAAQQQGPQPNPDMVKVEKDAELRTKEIETRAMVDAKKEENANAQKMRELEFKAYEVSVADKRERDLAALKLANQQAESAAQLEFQKSKTDGEMGLKREAAQAKQAPTVGVQLGADTEKAIAEAQATSAQAMMEAAGAMAEAAKGMTKTADTMGAMVDALKAPRRLVKDPKTGEKRAEMVLN
jgi:hypothetical protein